MKCGMIGWAAIPRHFIKPCGEPRQDDASPRTPGLYLNMMPMLMLHLACLLPGNALHWPMFDVIQSQLEISGEQDSEPSWGAQGRSRTSGASVSKSPLSWETLGHSTSAARFHTLYTCSTRTWGRSSFRCQITASSRPSPGSPTSPEERLQVRAHQPGQTEQGGWQASWGKTWLHPHAAWKQHGPRQEVKTQERVPGRHLSGAGWVPWPITPWAY